ncbi:unnamed protein product [Prunus brigantina]
MLMRRRLPCKWLWGSRSGPRRQKSTLLFGRRSEATARLKSSLSYWTKKETFHITQSPILKERDLILNHNTKRRAVCKLHSEGWPALGVLQSGRGST